MDSVTPPTVQPNPLFAPAAPPPKRGHKLLIGALIALIVLVLIAGSAAAAYRLGYLTLPFSSFFAPPLAPAEVLSRMYEATSTITSSTSAFDVNIKITPRDPAAIPLPDLAPKPHPNAAALERDQVRLNDARDLLLAIKQYKLEGGEGTYYPRQLTDILTPDNRERITTEIEARRYNYTQTAEGLNFSFSILLETPEARAAYYGAISNADSASPAVTALNTITLTATSQPVNVSLDGTASSLMHSTFNWLPVDFELAFHSESTGELVPDTDKAAAQFSVSGSLKMGGFTLAGDVDGIFLDNDFFIRLNEIPSLGLFDPSALQDKWVKVDTEEFFTKSGPSPEEIEQFKQEQAKQTALQQRFTTIAVEAARDVQLLRVIEEVPAVTAEDKEFYHYKLTVDRDKLTQFIEQVSQKMAAETNAPLDEEDLQSLREALAAQEWHPIYDAWQKSSTFDLWVDRVTFHPRRWSLTTAIVPPDSVLKFKNKQVTAALTGALNAINEPVNIEAPTPFISLDEAMLLVTGAPPPSANQNEDESFSPIQGIQDISWPDIWQELQNSAP